MRLQKNRILLNLYWASIYKDIADKAYRSARLAKLGVQEEGTGEKLEGEISLSSGDSAMIRRAMTGALAEIETLVIHEHSIWEQSHIGNNRILAEDNIKIIIMVPRNFDLAAVKPMAELIHDYIVQKTMYTWFSYTQPARAAEQLQLSQMTMQNILQLLRSRVRRLPHGTEVEVNIGDTPTEISEITLNKTTATLLALNESVTITASIAPATAEGTLTWELSPGTTCLTLTPSNDGTSCVIKLTALMNVQRKTNLIVTAENGVSASCQITYGEYGEDE